jgi:hypothetical protein
VGCGPQEEFRACADIAVTEADGHADDTPNTKLDSDVYVPKDETEVFNEVDYDEAANEDDPLLQSELKLEGVLIVVICSILSVALFFGGLFLYYTRGRALVQRLVAERDWDVPSLPALPTLPSLPLAITKLKASGVNWPLSNVQVNKLPKFRNKATAPLPPQHQQQVGSSFHDHFY